jgi:hypothetical protein
MTAELFTVATRTTAGLQRLQTSLLKFGGSLTVLGTNEPEYWGHGWRWKTFIRAAKASLADVVIHCDGYDSICLEPLSSMLAKFATLSHPIVFSYEPQQQPEFWLGLQPGLMMAERKALLAVFDDPTLEELFPDRFNDMYQLQSLYSWNPAAFLLDKQSAVFHTLGPRSPDLVVENNRLVNPATGLAPSFVHAPGGWDLSTVGQWLAAVNP